MGIFAQNERIVRGRQRDRNILHVYNVLRTSPRGRFTEDILRSTLQLYYWNAPFDVFNVSIYLFFFKRSSLTFQIWPMILVMFITKIVASAYRLNSASWFHNCCARMLCRLCIQSVTGERLKKKNKNYFQSKSSSQRSKSIGLVCWNLIPFIPYYVIGTCWIIRHAYKL